jgi:hypothetical protein
MCAGSTQPPPKWWPQRAYEKGYIFLAAQLAAIIICSCVYSAGREKEGKPADAELQGRAIIALATITCALPYCLPVSGQGTTNELHNTAVGAKISCVHSGFEV